MADGSITLALDEALSEELERRAVAAGISQQEFAQQALEHSLFDYYDYTWIGDDPRRETAEEPEVDLADCKPWDEVKRDLMARFEARLAAKA